MGNWQKDAIRFVAEHDNFATPHVDGGIWIYSRYVDRKTGRCDIERELAENTSEVRNVLGY